MDEQLDGGRSWMDEWTGREEEKSERLVGRRTNGLLNISSIECLLPLRSLLHGHFNVFDSWRTEALADRLLKYALSISHIDRSGAQDQFSNMSLSSSVGLVASAGPLPSISTSPFHLSTHLSMLLLEATLPKPLLDPLSALTNRPHIFSHLPFDSFDSISPSLLHSLTLANHSLPPCLDRRRRGATRVGFDEETHKEIPEFH